MNHSPTRPEGRSRSAIGFSIGGQRGPVGPRAEFRSEARIEPTLAESLDFAEWPRSEGRIGCRIDLGGAGAGARVGGPKIPPDYATR
jgi:hypothetical protein